MSEKAEILIVDDEPAVVETFTAILKRKDYNVISAADGEEALELYRKHRPRIVLADIKMPGMDGLELLRRLKSEGGEGVEVVMISGYFDVDAAVEAINAGAFRCLRKPVPANDILEALKGAMQRLEAADRQTECETRMAKFHEKSTLLRAKERHLHFLSNFDPLTGLPNRTMFERNLKQALAGADIQKNTFAVLFLDIDRFSLVNDALGHLTGDALLQAVAGRLRGCVRRQDMVARFGGDGFVVLLHGIGGAQDICAVAKKMLLNLSKPFAIDAQEFFITASLGISVYAEGGGEADILLRDANAALYRQKALGGNGYQFYADSMNADSSRQFALSNSLHKAFLAGELVLHYQPQFDLSTGEITGVEALIRWLHPQLGLVPPGDFIPIAEANGLIVPIGEWVLGNACRQTALWMSEGLPPLSVAVNLSARQFLQQDLPAVIVRTLSQTGLEPRMLELEITESTLIHNIEATASTMRELQALGVRISIDDFGTGYSSLTHLKRFPIHAIKIDRSFINDLAGGSDSEAIVTAVTAMARSLKLRVVAEGVETKGQLDILRALGCDAVQGYLLGRPAPPEQIKGILAARAGIRPPLRAAYAFPAPHPPLYP